MGEQKREKDCGSLTRAPAVLKVAMDEHSCLTRIAPRAGASGPIHNLVDKGASSSVMSE
jgi:hypothetical protein